jgi:hypothetical protein
LYRCEAFRIFENGALGKIFGPRREGVTEGWTKLCNEKYHNLYSSHNTVRMIKITEIRHFEILPLSKIKCKYEMNIKSEYFELLTGKQ